MTISQIISEEHIQTLIDGNLYFAPCKTFVDLMEFRFAHCWDSYGTPAFDECIRRSFANPAVQTEIENTSVSCWSLGPERLFMWEVYGESKAAIRLTVNREGLAAYLREQKGNTSASGPVRYGFAVSQVRPEFLSPPSDYAAKEHFDLFFHKHPFYRFEMEFRAIIREQGPVRFPLPERLLESITVSPFASLEHTVRKGLDRRFPGKVSESAIRLPYA